MQFHQDPCERFRDGMINILFEKNMLKEGVSIDDLKKVLPWENIVNKSNDIDSDSSDEESDIKVTQVIIDTPFSDSISDDIESDTNTTGTGDTEISIKPKKEKKEKKEKKSSNTDDKPKRMPSNFIYFKSHPDTQDAINEAGETNFQGDDDKKPGEKVGKVKGAGIVWKNLSDEEKEVWKQRSHEAFILSQNQ